MSPLKIAINTLYEDPFNPTSSHSYNMHVIQELARIDRVNQYLIFVSHANRHFFRVDAPNFRLVNCLFSNEHRKLRILAEQTLIPLYAWILGVDVLFAPGNTAPLLSPGQMVLNIKTMHHRTAPEGMGASRILFRNLMIGPAARKATLIVANSESNCQDICAYLNVPRVKIRLIPEGLDHSLFKPLENKAEIAKRLAERGIRAPYILYVSGLWRYKNVETLIHAFAQLVHGEFITHNLVIVGGGYRDYEDFLFALVRQLGLEQRVQFVGFVPYTETPLFYNGADVFVLPSKYETFGRITTEAMACGAPVVASNASSIPEVVKDAGVLVNPTDALAMAEAIKRIIQDPDWRAELVQRGFKRAQDFSWQKNVASLHQVLIEAAGLPLKA